jgi:hypothetical protein
MYQLHSMKGILKNVLTQKRRGFTVIEAFVGISILLIGLVGPLVLVNSNLQAGRFSRDQITAYYLAQEAIEMVREVRDENFLENDPSWLDGLSLCTGGACRVDGRLGATPFLSCNSECSSTNPLSFPLLVNSSNGQYGYGSGADSRFYRYVQITQPEGPSSAVVSVTVGFDTGRYIQEYTTTDYLRDWYPL